MSRLRLVFFGTPDFAVAPLRRLVHDGWPVVAVVTQPDRPRGRGQKPAPGPVKVAADPLGIPVLQPERLRDERFMEEVRRLGPDLGVVAAYGKILPQALLDVPRLGMVNVHASLLPRWRGASPVHRAVMAGDAETGVSIMRVVRELDAGPVFAAARRPIGPDETSEDVERGLAVEGADLLASVVEAIETGGARETPQGAAGVSYAPRLTKEDGLIAWDAPARAIHDQVRGLWPWPHAWTMFAEVRVIVLHTDVPGTAAPPLARPGEIVSIERTALLVAAGGGQTVRLLQVQLEGRRPVTGREFASGLRLSPGRQFRSCRQ